MADLSAVYLQMHVALVQLTVSYNATALIDFCCRYELSFFMMSSQTCGGGRNTSGRNCACSMLIE